MFRFNASLGDDGLNALYDPVGYHADAVGNQRGGLHQTDMAKNILAEVRFELVHAQAGTDFLLQLLASTRTIDNPFRPNMTDIRARGGQINDKTVHDKAGVDARAFDRDALVFR